MVNLFHKKINPAWVIFQGCGSLNVRYAVIHNQRRSETEIVGVDNDTNYWSCGSCDEEPPLAYNNSKHYWVGACETCLKKLGVLW